MHTQTRKLILASGIALASISGAVVTGIANAQVTAPVTPSTPVAPATSVAPATPVAPNTAPTVNVAPNTAPTTTVSPTVTVPPAPTCSPLVGKKLPNLPPCAK